MSSEASSTSAQDHLALRLEGPLQAWGVDSRFNRRSTQLFPSRSGILGMCCAALGASKGGAEEARWLKLLDSLHLLVFAIPKKIGETVASLGRMEDYHTVQNLRKADGGTKETEVTQREYLTDASFGAILSGDAVVVADLAQAFADPKWGVWLGRKCCVPSTPVLVSVCHSEEDAVKSLAGDVALESLDRVGDATDFAEGSDTFLDRPRNFATREFAPRRVKVERAVGSTSEEAP
jgi:CRISPR system Cascade subunit CasD